MGIVKRIFPALNLRIKIIIVLASYIIGILGMYLVAQNDLLTAQEKLETLELAYKLDTIILEVRRYEKNFLLYGTEESLRENRKQIDIALEMTAKIDLMAIKFKVHPLLVELRNTLLSYKEEMEMLAHLPRSKGDNASNIMSDGVRLEGQKMKELTDELVGFEHKQIRIILQELIFQLVVWSSVAIMIGIIIPMVMFFKIFKPLKIIKKATGDIAQGQFSPIEVVDTRDEMQQVIEAFNTMVSELQRRQDQLVQSQKLSSIGTLSAGIAHQLNNPLNNISTSCQIAISDFETGDAELIKRMLQNINRETSRARDVVQGLLEFSREKEFALRDANLEEVVNRAVSLVQSQVPSSVKVSVDIPSGLNLPMDSQRMQEVFLNLIINASQAITDAGEIKISAQVADSDSVCISVHDTGSGIPPEIQDRLFDPFFSTKEEGQGTGLGLSITYGIIQKHEGQITVESDPASGTTFLITLPLRSDGDK